MTSKEEYKGHVRALLTVWIRQLEDAEGVDSPGGGDPEVQVVIRAMKLELDGKEIPEELLR